MKSLISLAIFTVLAIFAWWSITEKYSDENRLHQAKTDRYVEIFMNEFDMTVMDDTGKPGYLLQGKKLEQYNNSSNIEIQYPVFHLAQPDRQWIVVADKAIVNEKNNTIRLHANVVMEQQNTEPAVTIRTQTLLIHTNTQIAETRAQVDITQGKSRLTSKGMIFNNITSKLELSSNVNGYYLPYE